MRPIGKLSCILLVLCVLVIVPAMADTKYLAGSPQLSASISGTNEFSPGDDVQLTVVIENTGVNDFKFVQSSIVGRDDLPNTAKFLTAALNSGNAPLVIKSDPQMVGDVKGSESVRVVYTTKINANAPTVSYILP